MIHIRELIFKCKDCFYRVVDELNPIWNEHMREVNNGNAIQIRKVEYKSSFVTQVSKLMEEQLRLYLFNDIVTFRMMVEMMNR